MDQHAYEAANPAYSCPAGYWSLQIDNVNQLAPRIARTAFLTCGNFRCGL